MNTQEQRRELDRALTAIFLDRNAAFLGPVLCNLNVGWSNKVKTARTNGLDIQINPDWFMTLPEATRKTVLLHEVWHTARLHRVREEDREHDIWNQACDFAINMALDQDGYTFDGIDNICLDRRFTDKAEEEIYQILMQESQNQKSNGGGSGKGKSQGQSSGSSNGGGNNGEDSEQDDNSLNNDMSNEQPQDQDGQSIPQQEVTQQMVNSIVNAMEQAKQAGGQQAGSIPGSVTEFIDKFLTPIIPWTKVLQDFFTALCDEQDYTWKRPNRRYQDMYMPSLQDDEEGLEHLMYFIDTSGSISDAQIKRVNSEIKYIQEQIRPRKLTLVQFDCAIQDIKEYELDDPFDYVEIHGRGGTNLDPVKEMIDKYKPTAAVIFSDLECAPMDEPECKCPVVWIGVDTSSSWSHTPSFGKLIEINT